MNYKIIQRGAEAIIKTEGKTIIKERTKKSYRITELDNKIRGQRTRSEGKILEKAAKLIPIPHIIEIDEENKKILMELIGGKKLSDCLDSLPLSKQKKICKNIGEQIAKLHDANIIHGDLTTSNLILAESKTDLPVHLTSRINDKNSNNNRLNIKVNPALNNYQRRSMAEPVSEQSIASKQSERDKFGTPCQEQTKNENYNFKIFFIDFGLGFHSQKIEDKAVDLHLLKEVLEAKHFQNWRELFNSVLDGYKTSKEAEKVFERLKAVEKRGRYKY